MIAEHQEMKNMRVEAAPDDAEVTKMRDSLSELITTEPFQQFRDAVAAAHAVVLPTRTTNSRVKRKPSYDATKHGDVPGRSEKKTKRVDSHKQV